MSKVKFLRNKKKCFFYIPVEFVSTRSKYTSTPIITLTLRAILEIYRLVPDPFCLKYIVVDVNHTTRTFELHSGFLKNKFLFRSCRFANNYKTFNVLRGFTVYNRRTVFRGLCIKQKPAINRSLFHLNTSRGVHEITRAILSFKPQPINFPRFRGA